MEKTHDLIGSSLRAPRQPPAAALQVLYFFVQIPSTLYALPVFCQMLGPTRSQIVPVVSCADAQSFHLVFLPSRKIPICFGFDFYSEPRSQISIGLRHFVVDQYSLEKNILCTLDNGSIQTFEAVEKSSRRRPIVNSSSIMSSDQATGSSSSQPGYWR